MSLVDNWKYFDFPFTWFSGFEGPKYLQNNSNYVSDNKFRKFFLQWSNNILKLSRPVRQFWRYHGNRGFNSLILQYLPFLLYKIIGSIHFKVYLFNIVSE